MCIVLLSFGFIDYTIQLANFLSKNGVIVLLIIPDNQIREHIGAIEDRVSTYTYTQPRFYYPTNIFLAYKLFKRIILFNPDIIHIQGGHPWFSFILPLLHSKRYPLVMTFHDVKPHIGENHLRTRFINYCGRTYSDKMIVHGEKLKEIMIKKYGIPNENVHVISIGEHNVVPFKKYDRKDLREEGNLILFFGRIYEYKGLKYLIKAEPLITKKMPNAKIIIAGRGEKFKKYENMMKNKENFIIYNHYISYKEGVELFQKCSVVALPYIDASQSAVIVTAYGFKKPVVTTNVGSIPEIVDNGKTGYIVPPRNPKVLAEAIVRLLKDEDLRKRMSENAYKKLRTDLSWDDIAKKTIEVYKEAIRNKNANN